MHAAETIMSHIIPYLCLDKNNVCRLYRLLSVYFDKNKMDRDIIETSVNVNNDLLPIINEF